jgi:hypothetical protein
MMERRELDHDGEAGAEPWRGGSWTMESWGGSWAMERRHGEAGGEEGAGPRWRDGSWSKHVKIK